MPLHLRHCSRPAQSVVRLVAGIAQALPIVGLLAATMSRVGAVMDLVKQADLVDQQKFQRANDSSKKLADTTDAVANAQDGLRNATDSLGDAHRRVADAQEGLTRARADAARQLRDLILAEKDAELAARGAALNQEDAQQRILDAVASGQGDLDRLGLDFEQAHARSHSSRYRLLPILVRDLRQPSPRWRRRL